MINRMKEQGKPVVKLTYICKCGEKWIVSIHNDARMNNAEIAGVELEFMNHKVNHVLEDVTKKMGWTK